MRFELMHERLFTNVSVCRRFEFASKNNTSQIFNGMVRLFVMNIHREAPAVVSDAVLMFLLVKTSYEFDRCSVKFVVCLKQKQTKNNDLDRIIIKRA